MIRMENLVLSRYPFAVNLATFTPGQGDGRSASAIDAVWFRRQSGVTAAYIGMLWGVQDPPPADAAEFLARHGTERDRGHSCHGRWDGNRYRGSVDPDVAAAHLEILRPVLEQYPEIPPGFDGWYVVGKDGAS
jgi:hypothetical protein